MKNAIKIAYIFWLFNFCDFSSSIIYAQSQIIEIDEISKTVKEQVPFDEPFILKVPRASKEKTVVEVIVFESFLLRKGARSYLDKKGREGARLQNPTFKQEGDALYIYLEAVNPNTYLEVVFRNRLHGQRLHKLLEINGLIANGSLILAKSKFEEWRLKLDGPSPYPALPVSAFGLSWLPDFWANYLSFYQSELYTWYASVKGHTYDQNLTYATLSKATNLASWGKSYGLRSIHLSQIMSLKSMPSSEWKKFMKGLRGLEANLVSTKINEFELAKRISTLSKNITGIKEIINFCDQVYLFSTANRTTINSIKSDFKKVIIKLDQNKKFLETNLKSITNAISENQNLRYGEALLLDNNFAELATESGFRVTPNLGFAQIFAFGNRENISLQRLYFGLSITPRPINKQIRFKEYKDKNLWRRLSISVGVTTRKLPEGEFEDLYNNVSLLTGVNYRFYRGLYLSLGTVLLRQKDPNPIINDSYAEPALYLGISLDLDIAQALEKVTGKLL